MVRVRPARVDDATQVVGVLRRGFSAELLNATIYGSDGVECFIRDQISTPHGLADTIYLIAEIGDQVIGCVELRRLRDSLFLNYIAVLPQHQGYGVGRILLSQAIRMVRGDSQNQMLLDVFQDNAPARQWYDRLGFRVLHQTDWWDLPLPHDTGEGQQAIITGFPQAEAVHERFGFSQFTATTAIGHYSIGRMGACWYRLTQQEALSDRVLLSTLRHMDPRRRILAQLPRQDNPPVAMPNVVPLCTSLRMSADLAELLVRIES